MLRALHLSLCMWPLVVKNPPTHAGDIRDVGLIPELGRPLEEYPLQYPCLENPMEKGAWWAQVHGAAKSQTGLYIHPRYILISAITLWQC